MFFSKSTINTAIDKLGLYTTYPYLKQNTISFRNYISSSLRESKFVGGYAKRSIMDINDKLCRGAYTTLQEFIITESNTNKRSYDHLIHFYKIFYGHSLSDYTATQYVETFCNKTIEQILDIFSFTNPSRSILGSIQPNPAFVPELTNIWNIMLTTELASIFYRLEFFINLKCLQMIGLARHRFENYYGKIVDMMIDDDFGENITYDNLVAEYPNTMSDIQRFSTTYRLGCRRQIERNDKIILIIKTIWDLIPKRKTKLPSNLDMKSIFGILPAHSIDNHYRDRDYIFKNFFKYYIINYKPAKQIVPKEEDIEPLIILSDLVVPVQSQTDNREIVIEI
jgi:hypothetical protein